MSWSHPRVLGTGVSAPPPPGFPGRHDPAGHGGNTTHPWVPCTWRRAGGRGCPDRGLGRRDLRTLTRLQSRWHISGVTGGSRELGPGGAGAAAPTERVQKPGDGGWGAFPDRVGSGATIGRGGEGPGEAKAGAWPPLRGSLWGPARKDLQKGVPWRWWLWVGQPPKQEAPKGCLLGRRGVGGAGRMGPAEPHRDHPGLMSLLV